VRQKPELILVGVTVLWASTFVITKDVVREMAPLPFLTARFGIAALVMIVIYARRFAGPAKEVRAAIRDGIVLGLLNSTGLVMQVFGQAYTTASKSAFITSLNTPLTPVIALVLYRTKPTRPQLAAVAIASVGLWLLTWPGTGARWNLGDLLTVGCALMYAFTIVQIARRSPGHDVGLLTAVQIATAALMFAILWAGARAWLAAAPLDRVPELLRLEARPMVLSARSIGEMVYMALVCTVVTFGGQTWAMARMSATHAAIIFALEPVFATAMALGITGSAEWPGTRGATGAGMVMLAVAVSEIL
jgi:drug/metabolite transporter (DMT)-like permease